MSPLMDDRVVLVTGAAAGIGRASAIAFAREGAAVVLTDIDAAALAGTVTIIEATGAAVTALAADITDEGTADLLIGHALSTYGRLDAAHNSAVTNIAACAFDMVDAAEFQRLMAVNVRSVFFCMRAQLRSFRDRTDGRRGGAIVNTASSSGLVGVAEMAPHAASMHAVIGLTKTAALEFAGSSIRVNAVCPGPTDPSMSAEIARLTPMQRLGTPEEVAESVVWLCSDRAGFVTGTTLQVDGGLVETEGQLRHD